MKKILIIENDIDIRRLLIQLLKMESYQVIAADNGKTGLTLLYQALPDVVICDLVMPELDGYGVLQGLLHNPDTARIPIIFLTASASDEERQKCLEQGASAFLVKPFLQQELLKLIRDLFDEQDYV